MRNLSGSTARAKVGTRHRARSIGSAGMQARLRRQSCSQSSSSTRTIKTWSPLSSKTDSVSMLTCVLLKKGQNIEKLASRRKGAEQGSAMRVLIAGASGPIGRALVRRLRANQHDVFGLIPSPDISPALKEIGAEPV